LRIIYLHGFSSSPESRKARFFREKLFAAGADVAVPALDGGDFSHLTISGQYQRIEQVAAGQPVSLLGSSMGGYLAALYAARHPEVERLVLMAPAFDIQSRWPHMLGPEKFRDWQESQWLEVYHYGDNAPRRVHWGLAEDCANWEPVPKVAQPVLLFHGLGDDTVPSAGSERYAAEHPNVRLHLFDAGHELTEVMNEMWVLTAAFLGIKGE
jgi:pimeloyl-ACP methyl ester carboxylesterase